MEAQGAKQGNLGSATGLRRKAARATAMYLAALGILSISVVALGLSEYKPGPPIGQPHPKNPSVYNAKKAQITEVGGSTRPFPPYFVVPSAWPGMLLTMRCERAKILQGGIWTEGEWDTWWHGDNCVLLEDPVKDDLKDEWPRWQPGHGDAHFIPRSPDDNAPEKGTCVVLRVPDYSGTAECTPAVYEDDAWVVADDYHTYGLMQDSVTIQVVDLVQLMICNSEGQEVSSVDPYAIPPGPDASNILGLFHDPAYADYDPENPADWRLCNTVSPPPELESLGDYSLGGSVYDANHDLKWGARGDAYGSGLKTEIRVRIDFADGSGVLYDIPSSIRAAMRTPENWIVTQDWKMQLMLIAGNTKTPIPPEVWSTASVLVWTRDFQERGLEGFCTEDAQMEAHFCGGSYPYHAWLYVGDAPGPKDWKGPMPGNFAPGTIIENRKMFRTGVKLMDDDGNCYSMVDPNDHIWHASCIMERTPTEAWEILLPSVNDGSWNIPPN